MVETPDLARTRIEYNGRTKEVVGIVIGNFLLSIPSLGFYRFWGKTRLRRYVWGHIEYLGERAEYTGTGRELFVGFLVGLAVLVPYAVISAVVQSQVESESGQIIAQLIGLIILFFLIHVAQFRARRYRLNRTSWRGIRGGQTGAAWRYGLAGVSLMALSILTLGLAVPLSRTVLQNMRTSNTWFGDKRFSFKARARTLMPSWLLCWILFFPSLGFSYLWYQAKEFRIFAAGTRFGDASFESDLTAASLLRVVGLYLLSWIVIVIIILIPYFWVDLTALSPEQIETAGDIPDDLVTPLIASSILTVVGIAIFGSVQRIIALQSLLPLVFSRLAIIGTVDFEAIVQSQQEKLSRGEGLADAFDVGEF